MSGYTLTQPELYYSLPTPITKASWTTSALLSAATTIPRCLIPAQYFTAPGKSAHFEANGVVQGTATSVTFTFAANLDVTANTPVNSLFTTGTAAVGVAATPMDYTIEGDIVCQAVGSAGLSLQCSGEIDVSVVASGTFSAGRLSAMFSTLLTGLNDEQAYYLELFGACSVSAAGNTNILQQFKVYLEN